MAELASTALFSDGNLVSYYKFENTTDSKGSITLTNNNSATFVAAKYNNGGSIGAANTNKSFSNGTNNPYGIGSGAFSFVGWIKILTELGSGGLYKIVDAESTTTNVTTELFYQDSAGTKTLDFFRTKNGVASQGPTPTITALGTTTIHHIGFTYDGSNIKGYLDGALIGGPTAASGNGTAGAVAGVAFGINRNDLVSNPASCIFDDWGIFTRALTLAEIQTLYNPGATGNFFLFM